MASHLIAITLIAAGSVFSVAESPSPEEIEGTWIEQIPEPSRVGKMVRRDPETLVIRGNLYITKVGDREFRQSLARKIPGGDPRAIDFMTVVSDQFWLSRAIYKVEKEQLTICEAVKDEERPTEFRSGNGLLPGEKFTSLRVYKRLARTEAVTSMAQAATPGVR